MTTEGFIRALRAEAEEFRSVVATGEGDWVVKGFIDVAKRIYTISADTKVISKILELLLLPHLARFADDHGLRMVLAAEQNHYPDVSFVDKAGRRFALDLKTAYRDNCTRVNAMTLGAYTGYFRDRTSTNKVTFPYGSYQCHVVLGAIYSRAPEPPDERRVFALPDLETVVSVVRDFEFFAQEKYRIAAARPGSGNTKNIGSVTAINDLMAGSGPFAPYGVEVFDDYWMYYMTRDMALKAEMPHPPYTTLEQYLKYKGLPQR